MFHLKPEAEPAEVGRTRDARPRGRLLRDRDDAGLAVVQHLVQLLQERDGLEILAPAERVRHPLARLAGVVEIEHRGDGVDAQPVGVELAHPVERVREQEVPHLVPAEVEDERAPVGMGAAARIGVLVERRPVELRERELVAREVRRHPVEDHADPGLMQRVDEGAEVVGRAERRLGRVEAGHLVAPGARERMVHHGQELDVRELELGGIGDELLGEILPAEPEAPRAGMHLVDRHRPAQRLGGATGVEPVRVAPVVGGREDDRRGLRRHLGGSRERIGLQAENPVGADDLELVPRSLGCGGHDSMPDSRRALRLERVGVAVPAVPVADHGELACVRSPDGERDPVGGDVRAEPLVDPLVAAFPRKMEIELAELRHHSASSMRTIPATGIPTQSGRLLSS